MDYINKYIISVCFSIIFCIIAETLMPSERYAKIIRMILGIFIVYTLITPVKNLINPSNYSLSSISPDITESDMYKKHERMTMEVFGKVFNGFAENEVRSDIEKMFGIKNVKLNFDSEDNSVTIFGVQLEKRKEIHEYFNNYGIKSYFAE